MVNNIKDVLLAAAMQCMKNDARNFMIIRIFLR
ncbi:hypothetical protein BMS3Bbin04_01691 [bacterium BMS3Bbin04]|nr:hypothetical protein BMS3Bbin04_01691 [bacterium BMS3Bbin04]